MISELHFCLIVCIVIHFLYGICREDVKTEIFTLHLNLPPLLISFGVVQIKSVQELSGQICQICGDGIEITDDGEIFVACNECAFPVCRACYQYERKEGNQACPQCKTRYKRIKGKSLCAFFKCIYFNFPCKFESFSN